MTESYEYFCWLSHPAAEAPAEPWKPLSDANYRERPARRPDHGRTLALAPAWAEDLQRVARAVFAADRRAPRLARFDRWTRHMRLDVPVTAPDRWSRALPHLLSLLSTVTGDVWDVSFRIYEKTRHHADPLGTEAQYIASEYTADEVALFSGGLDSLGWAAGRTSSTTSRLLLVSFEEANFETEQRRLFGAVSGLRKPLPRLLSENQAVIGPGGRRHAERSTRSRGLLYAAGAVKAAAAESVSLVHIPENGQLAVNFPLSAARSGACSTRSVHPWTLHHLNRVIAEIAAPNEGVRVTNPFADHTKGEVCVAARDAGLPREVLEATISCGQPPRRQPGHSDLAHCGVCFPCLIRRSGLLHAFGEDNTPYEANPWDTKLPTEKQRLWRALRRWLDREYTMLDLIADHPLPPQAEPDELLKVVEQGRRELRAWVAWAIGPH